MRRWKQIYDCAVPKCVMLTSSRGSPSHPSWLKRRGPGWRPILWRCTLLRKCWSVGTARWGHWSGMGVFAEVDKLSSSMFLPKTLESYERMHLLEAYVLPPWGACRPEPGKLVRPGLWVGWGTNPECGCLVFTSSTLLLWYSYWFWFSLWMSLYLNGNINILLIMMVVTRIAVLIFKSSTSVDKSPASYWTSVMNCKSFCVKP